MIHIVDYDMGNLRSVQKALEHLGYDAVTTADPDEVKKADRVLVPGVGAFEDAMANLRQSGLDQAIVEFAAGGKPLLGICLGLQLFFARSEEHGSHEGLGLFEGEVVRFSSDEVDEEGQPLKVPHMGWNTVEGRGELGRHLDGKWAYFVHSYYARAAKQDEVAGTTRYGVSFCAAAARDNIWATQFHPEKSGRAGMAVLRAFATR